MYFFDDVYDEEEYYKQLEEQGYHIKSPAQRRDSYKEEEPEIALIYSDGMKETIDLVKERNKKNAT